METDRAPLSLDHFPDEILVMIFQKLNSVDALYSLFGVNERFTRIVRDRILV